MWLGQEDHTTNRKGPKSKKPRLIDMQAYADGSRDPIGNLRLLWENPRL